MAKINSIRRIDLSVTDSPVEIKLDSQVSRYKFFGTKTMDEHINVTAVGTAQEGMVVVMDYTAVLSTTYLLGPGGDFTLTIFGVKVPQSMLAKKMKFYCEYLNTDWAVFMIPSVADYPIVAAEMLDSVTDGTTLTADAVTGKIGIKDGGVNTTQLASDSVGNSNLKTKCVSLAKMADLLRGSIIVGNSEGEPSSISAKTLGYILIGDGTDLKSVALSGDATIDGAGVLTIGASKILAAMIAEGQITNVLVSVTAGIEFTKMEALTASMIPALNSSGKIIASAVAAAKLLYLDVTTPGTAQESKALVLDAFKKIDTLDITSLKLNGTTITAAGAKINFLSGVTSDVQTQIDRAATRGMTIIEVGSTTPTAATLQSQYMADTSGGAVLLFLPAANTIPSGTTVRLTRVGASAASFYPSGTDTLFPVTSLTVDVPSVACSATGKSVVVTCDGLSSWYAVSEE